MTGEKQKYIFFFILILLFFSCHKDEKPGWDVAVLAPFAKSSLTIKDIVADSIRKTNPDNTVSLVYKTMLTDLTIDTNLKLPDTSNQANIKLETLTLDPVSITNTTTLMQIVSFLPDSDLIQLAIAMGISLPVPAFGPISQSNIPFDFGSYFQSMTISDGIVDIKINNNFPFPFTDVGFTIKNAGNDSIIFQQVIPLIPANDSVTVSSHLGHKDVESKLIATIDFSSPGNPVATKLDPAWNIKSSLSLHDLKIMAAVAKFPPQTVVYDANTNSYVLDKFEFSKVLFKQGILKIEVYNTLPTPLHYIYKIQSASKDGVPFEISGDIPAASGGVANHSTDTRDMTGYELDLRGIGPIEKMENKDLNNNGKFDADTINTFYNEVSASIMETTALIPLSLNDSVYIRGEFLGMVPLQGFGYLGNDTVEYKEDALIDNILAGISFDKLSLDSVNVNLVIQNRIGAAANVRVNSITAINSKTGQSASLTGTPVGQMISINKPENPYPADSVVPAATTIELKSRSCNIEKLLEIIPDKFSCDIQAFINPGIPSPVPGTGTDFIYYGKGIGADIDISIPLSFIAHNINLRDTTEINVEDLSTEKLSNNNFKLIVENGFPLDANVQLYLIDDMNNITDSLMQQSGAVAAAPVNTATGKVDQPAKSSINLLLSNAMIDKMRQNKRIVIKASFNTKPDDTMVNIYDDYRIQVTLIGNFNYRVN